MTTFHTRWYLLYRLNISLYNYRLLSLCSYTGRIIIIAGASRGDIVFHELFLKLCLLLPLPSNLLLAEILITIACISVKINGWSLSRKYIALLRRRNYHLLSRVINNNLWHVLSKGRGLLVRIWSRVATWWGVISPWICICIIESLCWIQYLTQTFLNWLHQISN